MLPQVFLLTAENFYYPEDKSPRYTVVEISMFKGRSVEAKKRLFWPLLERVQNELGL